MSYIPELEADVRALGFRILPIQLATIILTIRTDRVNHDSFSESAVFEGRSSVGIGG